MVRSEWRAQHFLDRSVPTAVLPALATLLTPDERESVRIRVTDWEGTEVGGATPIGENDLILEITVLGEEFRMHLFEPEFARTWERQFYNDFQDFISESAFGWGQLRGPVRSLEGD